MIHNIIQHNTLLNALNTTQYNAIQHNIIRYNIIHSTMLCAISDYTTQCYKILKTVDNKVSTSSIITIEFI